MRITQKGKQVSIKLTEREFEILSFVWKNGYGDGDILPFYTGYDKRLCVSIDEALEEGVTDDK